MTVVLHKQAPHNLANVVTIQLSLLIELENYSVQLVLFEQTYVQLLALTSMFSCQHISLQCFVVEGDSSEFGDCLESQRINKNLNRRKSPTFVVHL